MTEIFTGLFLLTGKLVWLVIGSIIIGVSAGVTRHWMGYTDDVFKSICRMLKAFFSGCFRMFLNILGMIFRR